MYIKKDKSMYKFEILTKTFKYSEKVVSSIINKIDILDIKDNATQRRKNFNFQVK